MSRIALASLAFGAAACSPVGMTDQAEQDTDPPPCGNGIFDLYPEEAAVGVYYRTPVEARFYDADEDGLTVTLNQAGAAVPGTEQWASDRWIFQPAEPLIPNTEYTIDVSYSCGTPSMSFTTGDVGTTMVESPVGRTYLLDVRTGRLAMLPGASDILEQVLSDVVVLVEVVEENLLGRTLEVRGAYAEAQGGEWVQDPCLPSLEFPEPADFSEAPFVELDAGALTGTADGVEFALGPDPITGAFAPDASSLAGVSMAFQLDTRTIPVDPTWSEGDLCEFLASLDLPCGGCGDGDPLCLKVVVDSIVAPELPGVALSEVTAADVLADPTCDEPSR